MKMTRSDDYVQAFVAWCKQEGIEYSSNPREIVNELLLRQPNIEEVLMPTRDGTLERVLLGISLNEAGRKFITKKV